MDSNINTQNGNNNAIKRYILDEKVPDKVCINMVHVCGNTFSTCHLSMFTWFLFRWNGLTCKKTKYLPSVIP